MEDSRTFIFLLALAVILLINRLLESGGKRGSRSEAPAPESIEEQPDGDAPEYVPAEVRPRRMKPQFMSRADRVPGMRATDPSFAAQTAARRLVSGRENLRRAVIAMTVLGPPVAMRSDSASPGGPPE